MSPPTGCASCSRGRCTTTSSRSGPPPPRCRTSASGSTPSTARTAIAATLDGLAASLGTLDSKLTARLERLDERLDDQYDRVRAIESAVQGQSVSLEEAVGKAVESASADIMARIASLEDTVFTLAEALLRPSSIR